MYNVRAYNSFLIFAVLYQVAYTTLNKMPAVFFLHNCVEFRRLHVATSRY